MVVLEFRCFFETAVLQLCSLHDNRIACFNVQVDVKQALSSDSGHELRDIQLVFVTQSAPQVLRRAGRQNPGTVGEDVEDETLDGASKSREVQMYEVGAPPPHRAGAGG